MEENYQYGIQAYNGYEESWEVDWFSMDDSEEVVRAAYNQLVAVFPWPEEVKLVRRLLGPVETVY